MYVCMYVRTESVFSVCVDSTGTLTCSGGEDDQAFVWSATDGSVNFQCPGGWNSDLVS